MSYIDESTHLQMGFSMDALIETIEALQARTGHPLSYAEMHIIRHAKELRKADRRQLQLAGVIPPAPLGAKP